MWNSQQEEQLRKLLEKRPFDWAKVTEEMKKTRAAVQSKAYRMQLTKRKYSGTGMIYIFEKWYGKIPNRAFQKNFFPKMSIPAIRVKAYRLKKKGYNISHYKKIEE